MKINGYAVPVALGIAIVTGAVAYGVQKKTVEDNAKRIEQLEKTPLKVWEIDKRTSVMKEKIENLTREQRAYREQTVRALDHILRKLDEPTR
jgi:predicted transcriptional regulator